MQTLQGLWRSHSRFHLHAQCCQQGIYRGRPGGSSHQPSTQALSSRSVDSTWCEMSWRHRMRPFGDVTKFRACEREEIAWVQGCVLTYCFSSVISELFEYKIHRPLCTELLCAWVACSQITLTRIQYSIVGIRLFIFNLLVSIWFPYFKFKQKKKKTKTKSIPGVTEKQNKLWWRACFVLCLLFVSGFDEVVWRLTTRSLSRSKYLFSLHQNTHKGKLKKKTGQHTITWHWFLLSSLHTCRSQNLNISPPPRPTWKS